MRTKKIRLKIRKIRKIRNSGCKDFRCTERWNNFEDTPKIEEKRMKNMLKIER